MDGIDTRLVYGFLDAGKTTYIKETIRDDMFYKRGKTLILCFEEGEEEYDAEVLADKNAVVVYYDGDFSGIDESSASNGGSYSGESENEITRFCSDAIKKYQPDRIYVEMNAMMLDLREQLPDCMRVTVAVTLIDWATMPVYFVNFKKMINQMVADSQQITFRGCPSKELLAPYSQAFRLMNQKASYLRQDPMGYHEKAFDMFLPFSLEDSEITITESNYLPLWLDALDHPEHYEGKTLHFTDPLELRRTGEDDPWSAGRVVMVCCMADLQFMAFRLVGDFTISDLGWITFDASAQIKADQYGQRKLVLKPDNIRPALPLDNPILDGNKQ